MRTEVPVFKRCCFCLPLRHSLIVYAYFKLIITFILMVYFLVMLANIIDAIITMRNYTLFITETIIVIVILATMIVDIILHILFLVGAHKKEVKFFRLYCIYSLIILVLSFPLYLYFVSATITYSAFRYHDSINLSAWASMFIDLLIQAYVILLVRSEYVKLNNVGSFRFVNNAAEAECNLQVEYPPKVIGKTNMDHEEMNGNIV